MNKKETRIAFRSAQHLIDNMAGFSLPWANDYILSGVGPDKGPDPYEDILFNASDELMKALSHLLEAKKLVTQATKVKKKP